MVKHQTPKRSLYDNISNILSANSPLSEEIYTFSNGDSIKLGYVTDYIFKGNSHITRIEEIWFKGQIGNSYNIGFVGNSISGGNPPTLLYLNIYNKSLYNNIKTRILKH